MNREEVIWWKYSLAIFNLCESEKVTGSLQHCLYVYHIGQWKGGTKPKWHSSPQCSETNSYTYRQISRFFPLLNAVHPVVVSTKTFVYIKFTIFQFTFAVKSPVCLCRSFEVLNFIWFSYFFSTILSFNWCGWVHVYIWFCFVDKFVRLFKRIQIIPISTPEK